MKRVLFILITSLLCSISQAFDQFEFNGSFALRYRYQENKEAETDNRVQQRIRLQLYVPISSSLKMILQGQTGDESFTSGWENVIDFQEGGAPVDFNFKVRRAYFDFNANSVVSNLYAGALPSYGRSIMQSSFHIDRDGWIDGIRARFEDILGKSDSIEVTFGKIDTDDSNAFKRGIFDLSDYDYVRIDFVGVLSEELKYQIQLEDSQEGGFISTLIKRSFTYFESEIKVSIEALYDFNHSYFAGKGAFIEYSKDYYKIKAGFSSNRIEDLRHSITDGFLGARGDQAYLIFQKRNLFDTNLTWFTRFRYCTSGSICDEKLRIDTGIEGRFR